MEIEILSFLFLLPRHAGRFQKMMSQKLFTAWTVVVVS